MESKQIKTRDCPVCKKEKGNQERKKGKKERKKERKKNRKEEKKERRKKQKREKKGEPLSSAAEVRSKEGFFRQNTLIIRACRSANW